MVVSLAPPLMSIWASFRVDSASVNATKPQKNGTEELLQMTHNDVDSGYWLMIGLPLIFLLLTIGSCVTGCFLGEKRFRAMELHKAVESNNMKQVEELLLDTSASTVNYVFNDGWTPLHIAADQGREKMARLLMAAKADLGIRDVDDFLPYERANSVSLFKMLGGPDLPLHAAAQKGDITEVEARLKLGDDTNARDCQGRTAVHNAAEGGFTNIVRTLVQAKADLGDYTARDKKGVAPLHHAAREGHLEAVQYLVSAKVTVNCQDAEGVAPLHFAAGRVHLGVLQYLLDNHSDPNIEDYNGKTAIWCNIRGAKFGDHRVTQALTAAKADVACSPCTPINTLPFPRLGSTRG